LGLETGKEWVTDVAVDGGQFRAAGEKPLVVGIAIESCGCHACQPTNVKTAAFHAMRIKLSSKVARFGLASSCRECAITLVMCTTPKFRLRKSRFCSKITALAGIRDQVCYRLHLRR
jgi:hypothetical protein